MYFKLFSTVAICAWALCDNVAPKNTSFDRTGVDNGHEIDIIYDYVEEGVINVEQVTPHVERSRKFPKRFVHGEGDVNQVKDVLQQLFSGRFTGNQFPSFFTAANFYDESFIYEVTNNGSQLDRHVGLTAHPTWYNTTVNEHVKVVPKVKLVTKRIKKAKKRFAQYNPIVKPRRIKLGHVLMPMNISNVTKIPTSNEELQSKSTVTENTSIFLKLNPTLTPLSHDNNDVSATRTEYRRNFVDKLKQRGKALLYPEKFRVQTEGEASIAEMAIGTEFNFGTNTATSSGETDTEIGTTDVSVNVEIAVGTDFETGGPETADSNETNVNVLTTVTEMEPEDTIGNVARQMVTTTKLNSMTTLDLSSLLAEYEKTRPQFDVPVLLDIIANLTYDYEVNLTQRLNETLRKMSMPTCSTDPPTTTPIPPTPPSKLLNRVIQKCFVCGLDMKGIPQSGHCADAFATDFLQLTPVDPTARGHIAKFRKYCRWKNVNNYWVNDSDPRSVYGKWSGGCAVRWIDLSGLYTQRTCRNKDRATLGNHFLSKRMAKLEMALTGIKNGCIVSPLASLVPFSRAVSLYARFHACVCTGNWCNAADYNSGSILHVITFVLVVSWQSWTCSGIH